MPPINATQVAAVEAPDLDEIEIATVLHALSDPVRLEIVRQLAAQGEGGELTCGELDLPVSKSTASHHFKVLSGAGVTAERHEATRKHLCLRRSELDRRYPGLIDSVLKAANAG